MKGMGDFFSAPADFGHFHSDQPQSPTREESSDAELENQAQPENEEPETEELPDIDARSEPNHVMRCTIRFSSRVNI